MSRGDGARELRDAAVRGAEQRPDLAGFYTTNAQYWEATARAVDETDTASPDRMSTVREWEAAYLADDEETVADLTPRLWPAAPTLADFTPYSGDRGPIA